LLGGWLVDAVSWRAIFLLNVPIGLAAAWLAWRYIRDSVDHMTAVALDWSGAGAATFGLALLTWALTAAAQPSSRPLVMLFAAAGLGLLVLFVWIEARRGVHAMMPLSLFTTRTFTGLTILTFFLYAALGGLFVLLPYTLIEVGGFNAVQAGAALLPLPVLIGVGSRSTGKLAARVGSRLMLTAGSVLVAAGFVLLLGASSDTINYWTDVFPGILLVSSGMATCVAPLTTAVMASVDKAHVGTASGFNSAIARIGSLLATASLGFVFSEQASATALISGYRLAALAGALAAVLSAVAAATLVARPQAVRQ